METKEQEKSRRERETEMRM